MDPYLCSHWKISQIYQRLLQNLSWPLTSQRVMARFHCSPVTKKTTLFLLLCICHLRKKRKKKIHCIISWILPLNLFHCIRTNCELITITFWQYRIAQAAFIYSESTWDEKRIDKHTIGLFQSHQSQLLSEEFFGTMNVLLQQLVHTVWTHNSTLLCNLNKVDVVVVVCILLLTNVTTLGAVLESCDEASHTLEEILTDIERCCLALYVSHRANTSSVEQFQSNLDQKDES